MITPFRPGDLVRCHFSLRNLETRDYEECFKGCIFRIEKLYYCNDNVPFAFIRLVEGTCESRTAMTQRLSMQRKWLRQLPPLVQIARAADEN